VLLLSSLVFYGWHVPSYLSILLASAAVDYYAALAIVRRPAVDAAAIRRRRLILFASLGTNLGLLGSFKYADFGIGLAGQAASAFGFSPTLPTMGLMLPMGISFYTFQSMSYTIDVYRGRLAPLHRFSTFLLFISFFPQLVAGPIVRAAEFLPQLPRVRRPHLRMLNEGLFLLISGYFLKMVCADNIAVFVNRFWRAGYEPGEDSGVLLWLALMFSGQIFCDFAGYSNIARGAALMLGFRLPINFNAPYIAASFQNFWERWHMTLSRWLRDYLYVSLGGNRISKVRTYVNLLLTMVLGGLWHGAAWTFVLWGALHGVALAIERGLGLQQRGHARPAVVRVLWWFVVQGVVLTAWIFFRSEHIGGAWQFCRNIASLQFSQPADIMWFGSLFLIPPIVMHGWRLCEEHRLVRQPGAYQKAALSGVLVFLILTCYGPTNAFIYFQF
jgi:alginate O-acetyltransferase complex protein AlgI